MVHLSVIGGHRLPKTENAQKMLFKLVEYGDLVNTSLNKDNLLALAQMTGDEEFTGLVKEFDLKQVVRSNNHITAHF